MTQKQNSLYWREWAAALRRKPEIDRHEVTTRALGRLKSHKHFSNQDFDQVLAAFRAISAPDELRHQLCAQNQERKRMLYAVEREYFVALGFYDQDPIGYMDRLLGQRFGRQAPRDMDMETLQHLRWTLASRVNDLRRLHDETVDEMWTKIRAANRARPAPADPPPAFHPQHETPPSLALASARVPEPLAEPEFIPF